MSDVWQPIKDAPKDGTEIIVRDSVGGIHGAKWDEDATPPGWYHHRNRGWLPSASVWMPIPDTDLEAAIDDYNAALSFALNERDGEGLTFLRLWNEGDWFGLAREFPEYTPSPVLTGTRWLNGLSLLLVRDLRRVDGFRFDGDADILLLPDGKYFLTKPYQGGPYLLKLYDSKGVPLEDCCISIGSGDGRQRDEDMQVPFYRHVMLTTFKSHIYEEDFE